MLLLPLQLILLLPSQLLPLLPSQLLPLLAPLPLPLLLYYYTTTTHYYTTTTSTSATTATIAATTTTTTSIHSSTHWKMLVLQRYPRILIWRPCSSTLGCLCLIIILTTDYYYHHHYIPRRCFPLTVSIRGRRECKSRSRSAAIRTLRLQQEWPCTA